MPTDLKSDTDSLKSAPDAARTTASDGDSIAPRSVVRDSLKSQTARANGAQSRGPVTPQGRARASANSLRHGFTAASVVLPTESSQDFQSLLDSYLDQSLALLMRYEGALNRTYHRAFKQLLLLQSARHRAQPNEPKPQPAPEPVTPSVVSPIPAPGPRSTNTVGLSYTGGPPSSDAQAAPGIADPGPDPTLHSPPSSPPLLRPVLF